MEMYQNLVDMFGEENAFVVVVFAALSILVPFIKSMFQSKKEEQPNKTSETIKESNKKETEQ